MEAPETKFKPSNVGRAPFQYSLRTMFIVMTVLAVALSGIFAGPPWLSILTGLFLGVAAPMVLTVALIYGRGYVRTFSIGGLFPAGLSLIGLLPVLNDPFYYMRDFADRNYPDAPVYVGIWVLVAGVMTVARGLTAMGMRWMIEAPQRQQEREASLREQASPAPGQEDPTAPES